MANIGAFAEQVSEYEKWFDKYHYVYESELEALKLLVPGDGVGLEVGLGTGRFALPLGIKIGVEPSKAMGAIAQTKNLEVIRAVAEALPFLNGQYDYVLFVTVVCFLDSLAQAFAEAFRVVKTGGAVLIGLIDKDSPLGSVYEQRKNESKFYQEANFHSVEEVLFALAKAGFGDFTFAETVFRPLPAIQAIEPVKEGYGEGSFVVIRAMK
ncbi:MAG: class I SAM-dependent methyltransferase [Thermodesulfovibrionia bacterium]|nr:class I SAM-dependent methyltransferase [Thermodesulfovibrionia bacterium]